MISTKQVQNVAQKLLSNGNKSMLLVRFEDKSKNAITDIQEYQLEGIVTNFANNARKVAEFTNYGDTELLGNNDLER